MTKIETLCIPCGAAAMGCLYREGIIYYLKDGKPRADLPIEFPDLASCPAVDDLLDESIPVEKLVSEFDVECSGNKIKNPKNQEPPSSSTTS